MEIIVASGNLKKLKELNNILKETNFNIKSITPEETIDVIEDGTTFEENAIKKALEHAKKLNKIVLADDSGICINQLNGAPGLFSKRYSGIGDHENNLKVLENLKNHKDRSAYFVCVIALAFPDGKTFTFKGIWNGMIALEIKGKQGFGYDPIFIPVGQDDVVANLSDSYKMMHSHRYIAINKLLESKDEVMKYWNDSPKY